MTGDSLQKKLKEYSNILQLAGDSHYILVMEAMCEIQDLQAKFTSVQQNYLELLNKQHNMIQELIDKGNEKVINPEWLNPDWQVGYITGVSDSIAIVKQGEDVNETE